jgi:hypothetical protein
MISMQYLSSNSTFAKETRKNMENLDRNGRSQALPVVYWLLASCLAYRSANLAAVFTRANALFLKTHRISIISNSMEQSHSFGQQTGKQKILRRMVASIP